MADVDRCVCCGEIVPEGRIVCPQCENGAEQNGNKKTTYVVRGRWIKRQFADEPTAFGYRCSECHLTYEVDTNYCPNCGAKMNGGNNSVE